MQKPETTPSLLDQEITAALHSQPRVSTPACLPSSALRALAKGITSEETATFQMAHIAFCALCRDNYILMQRSYTMAQQARQSATALPEMEADPSQIPSGATAAQSAPSTLSTLWNRIRRAPLLVGSVVGVLVAGSFAVGYLNSVVVPQRARLTQLEQRIKDQDRQIVQQQQQTSEQAKKLQAVQEDNAHLQIKYAESEQNKEHLLAEVERLRHQSAQVQIAYDPTKFLKRKLQSGLDVPPNSLPPTMRSGSPQPALAELTPMMPRKSKLLSMPARFEVKPLPLASQYQFTISDAEFHALKQSPRLSGPIWKHNISNRDLPRAVPLEWQAIAYDRNNKQIGISTSAFQLTDQQSFISFLNTKLALGIQYAEGGDVEAARREFQSVLALDASNIEAKKLLHDLPITP